MKVCKNPKCQKEFEPVKGVSIGAYCSRQCYNKDYYKSLKGLTPREDAPPKTSSMKEDVPSTTGLQLPPTAQFIIDELKRSRERLQKEFDEQRVKIKELKEQKAKLIQDLTDLKNEEATKNKPSQLGSLMESSAVKELMPYIGPELAGWVKKLRESGGSNQIAGLEGDAQKMATGIINWFAAQDSDTQTAFYIMVDELASDKRTPEKRVQYLTQFHNLLINKPGTSTTGKSNFGSPTANAGAAVNF